MITHDITLVAQNWPGSNIYTIEIYKFLAGELTQELRVFSSSRGPGFRSQYPYGSSQLSLMPLPGVQYYVLTSVDTAHMCYPCDKHT